MGIVVGLRIGTADSDGLILGKGLRLELECYANNKRRGPAISSQQAGQPFGAVIRCCSLVKLLGLALLPRRLKDALEAIIIWRI